MGFWDFLWLLVWSFFFVMYLVVLFQIIGDLFRDHAMSGWLKAAWVIALLLVPFLSALIYVIVRGQGMAERQAQRVVAARETTDEYIKSVAIRTSAAEEIASAKALLDSGTLTQHEFDTLKQKALA